MRIAPFSDIHSNYVLLILDKRLQPQTATALQVNLEDWEYDAEASALSIENSLLLDDVAQALLDAR